jgi:hypothetical protein
MNMRLGKYLQKKAFYVLFEILVIFSLGASCKNDPPWLADFRVIIDRINEDLEKIQPMLAAHATEKEVYEGLLYLEKTLEYVAAESSRVYMQYPEIPERADLIEERLAAEFDRLRKNMELTASTVRSWYVKLKHKKKFEEVLKRIGKRMKQISVSTQRG